MIDIDGERKEGLSTEFARIVIEEEFGGYEAWIAETREGSERDRYVASCAIRAVLDTGSVDLDKLYQVQNARSE